MILLFVLLSLAHTQNLTFVAHVVRHGARAPKQLFSFNQA